MKLNRKILLLTISILFIAMLASSIVSIISFRKNYTEALISGSYGIGQSLNSIISEMLALGLPLESLAGMDKKLRQLLESNPHISYVGIADLKGKAVYHSTPELIGNVFKDEVMQNSAASLNLLTQTYQRFDGKEYFDVSLPIFDANKTHIGVIRLGFLTEVVNAKVRDAIIQVTFNFTLAFILISFLINYLLMRLVSKPVIALSEQARKIADGKFDVALPAANKDEIGELSNSISVMATTIKSQMEDLKNSRDDLDVLVQQRTAQLGEANTHLLEQNQELAKTIALKDELAAQQQISESKYRLLFESSSDAVMLLDDKHFIDCNEATVKMFGCRDVQEFCTLHPGQVSPPTQANGANSMEFAQKYIQAAFDNKSQFFEWTHRRVDTGADFPAEVLLNSLTLDGKPVLQAVVRDISERKAAAEEINNLAFFDPLTGLPNRRLLLNRLKHSLASISRTNRQGALLFIDLDNFKTLNDTLGHDMGDVLLCQVAQRLNGCVREGDTVARLGGDEFVVMLEDLNSQTNAAAAQAKAVCEKILSSLNHPYLLNSLEYHNTPSIGATLFSDQQKSIDELMKQADIAMYQSKKAGRNTLRFFDPQMQETITARAHLEDTLRSALANHEFQLYFQIQVDNHHHPMGAEVLIRWIHPQHGLVAPAHFIPLAEESGLILPIGLWVLNTACAQLSAWQENILTAHLVLAVNVSAKQFRQPDFVSQVSSAISYYAINPKLLKLELTESMLLDDIEATIATMNALNSLGVQFSLDDFGTGYSSLQYLKRLPLNQIKIDQSFVRDLVIDQSDRAIVRTIIAMAGSLNLNIIAEGVETEDQRQLLLSKGCTHYQGYLFSRPVPIESFEALLLHV